MAVRDFSSHAIHQEVKQTMRGHYLFVVRTCETSLALGPSYTFESSSPLSFRFQRPKL
jgi:hypothetical protein